MGALPAGRHFFRGDDAYEAARRGTVWHQRVPDRYPEVIVQAVDADEIVAGLRYAKANGQLVSIVSGGHSFAASHLRDGAVLLDVSRLDDITIDADRGVAVVGPGKGGSPLMADLEARGLFFPGGHCKGVCVGGYLLQGGYGWNSRIYGPACESVAGLDVITADGEKIHCDADNHADLYWAARGAGPGFFGVVTSFYLKLYPRPAVCGTSVYVYPWDVADEVYTWARSISAEVDRRVELQALATRSVAELGIDAPGIVFASPAFADSEGEAEKALAIFGTCPVVDQAMVKVPYLRSDLPTWYTAVMTHYLDDHRYTADNMWTSASAEELLPGIRTILDTMPPHPSHFLWLNWGPSPPRQDMAYSVEDEIYLALYGSWKEPADDDNYGDWARSNMAAM
jgi:FAD/FMN-containing dehydrogenase